MLFIGILFIAVIADMALLGSDNRIKVMDDFCKLECKCCRQKNKSYEGFL